MNKLQALQALIEPIVQEQGLELVDMQYQKEGKNWFLRIFIDNADGISHKECTRVSQALDPVLEEQEIITESYILEVSSPGLNRPLKKEKDFVRFAGKKIVVKTEEAVANQKTFTGILLGIEDGEVQMELADGSPVGISLDNIKKANLTVEL